MEVERGKVPQFDGTNWDNWRFRILSVLAEKDLEAYVMQSLEQFMESLDKDATERQTTSGTLASLKETVKKNDRKCKAILIQYVSDSHLEYIKDKKTAYEMFNALKEVFEKTGTRNQLFYKKKLLALKFDGSTSLQTHFLAFDRLVRDLKNAGGTMTESDMVCHLLLTLPENYDNLVTAIETINDEKLSINFVKTRLLDEELKQKGTSSFDTCESKNVAFYGNSGNYFKFQCHHCGRRGHKRDACRLLQGKNFQKERHFQNNWQKKQNANVCFEEFSDILSEESNSDDDEIAFLSDTLQNPHVSSKWFLDSGCSDHMVTDITYLTDVKSLEQPIKVSIANKGGYMIATKSGNLLTFCHTNGKMQKIRITDILVVPHLRYNLLSVRRIVQAGFQVLFKGSVVEIKKKSQLLATGHLVGKLYQMDFIMPDYANMTETTRAQSNLDLWHKRFGHICNANLFKLFHKNMVENLTLSSSDFTSDLKTPCEGCMSGKQVQQPFKTVKKKSSRPLELVHTDICGPLSPLTWDGARYFITFIDDFTHFTHVYLLSHKSQANEKFQEFYAIVTAKFNVKLSRLRLDNGGEYRSRLFLHFCKKNGIDLEWTIPDTPQQNGIAERMNRSLLEKARCMINNAQINTMFWGEAILTACFLLNRSPTSSLQEPITPAEMWYKYKPNVAHFKVFGCTAYTLVPARKRTKLSSKSKKCIFVGYAKNGYRLWDIDTKRVITSRNVRFDETTVKHEFLPSTSPYYEKENEEEENKEENQQTRVQTEENEEVTKKAEEEHIEDMSKKNNTEEDKQDTQELAEPRRSSRITRAPDWYSDSNYSAVVLSVENLGVDDEPKTFKQAMESPNHKKWMAAMMDEYQSLAKNCTWVLVQPPPNKNIIGCKWVFKQKKNAEGAVTRFKARLVAKGYSQIEGEDFNETFAPVAKLETVRIILALSNQYNFHLAQLDVKTAFLNGFIDEELFMHQPEGFSDKHNPEYVCKLKKSLYGLKQAPRKWNERFNNFLLKIKFLRSTNDYCLYIKINENSRIFLVVFVDDIILASNSTDEIEDLKSKLKTEFEMEDLGDLKYFLGISVERNKECGTLKLDQKGYIQKLLTAFSMEDSNDATTPMEVNLRLQKEGQSSQNIPYRQLVGSLMYLMLATRPDICFPLNYLSQFQNCYSEEHWIHLKRILKYLKCTLNLQLTFSNSDNGLLKGYADADWANDVSDRKSVTGYIFKLFDNTVSWCTRKQQCVTLSSTEAEYVALSSAVCEALWLRKLLNDLHIELLITPIFEDNISCINIAKDPVYHKRSKHIDVKFHHIRENIEKKLINLQYIKTEQQQADILTKSLPKQKFQFLRAELKLL